MPVQNVLIVDDSKSARVMLGRLLSTQGVGSWFCETAELALLALRTQPLPDVIFMDHMMPGMNGLQAVQQLKADMRTASVPVVMYTTRDEHDYWQQAIDSGAFDVVNKPVKPQAIHNIISRLNYFLTQGVDIEDTSVDSRFVDDASNSVMEEIAEDEAHQALAVPILIHQQETNISQHLASIEARLTDMDSFLLKQQERFLFKDDLGQQLLKLRQTAFDDMDKRLRPLINAIHQHNQLLEMKGDAYEHWLSRLQQHILSPQVEALAENLRGIEARLELISEADERATKSTTPVRPSLMKLACWVLLLTACSLLYRALNL